MPDIYFAFHSNSILPVDIAENQRGHSHTADGGNEQQYATGSFKV